MKSVLMSIQPKWCELIASGKKTVEVRKTKPKLDVPFKVYIYCTQARMPIRNNGRILMYEDDLALTNRWGQGKKVENPCGAMMDGEFFLNGKVIGEFVCDYITGLKADNIIQAYYNNTKETCLTDKEITRYANGKKVFYWHISNLVIYDKPKELHHFFKPCGACDKKGTRRCTEESTPCRAKVITRPPQSWCYVEGGELSG